MSAQEVKLKLKETIRSARELLLTLKKATHEQLRRTAPKVTHTLDKSFDRASKGLSDTLKLISKKTTREQLELLRSYRSLLQKQNEFVEAKIKALEKQETPDTNS